MQLSNTSQYAIRTLTYMATHKEVQMNATQLSTVLDIPYKFLTKIMTDLVKVDLVESIRGREGGYRLKKQSREIALRDILTVFHDGIEQEQCILGIGVCSSLCKCALHDQWVAPKQQIQQMFEQTTLADIAGQGCKI